MSCEGREHKEWAPTHGHRQGSASITRYTRKLEREEKRSPLTEAYTIARRIDEGGTMYTRNTKTKPNDILS